MSKYKYTINIAFDSNISEFPKDAKLWVDNITDAIEKKFNEVVDDYVPYRTGNLHNSKKSETRHRNGVNDIIVSWDASEHRKRGTKWYASAADYPFKNDGVTPKVYNQTVHSKARGWWIQAVMDNKDSGFDIDKIAEEIPLGE